MPQFDPPSDPFGDEKRCRICDADLTYNPLIREWECTQDHEEDNLETFYVTIYMVDLFYGGPEEGGWYYTCGDPILDPIEGQSRNRVFDGKDAENRAERYAEGLRKLCEHLNEGRPEITSVASRGRYDVVVEENPPALFPAQRPHYE